MTHIQNIPAIYNKHSNGWTKHSKTMKFLRSSCYINVSKESHSLKKYRFVLFIAEKISAFYASFTMECGGAKRLYPTFWARLAKFTCNFIR